MEKLKVLRIPIPTPTLWPHTSTNCYLIGNHHESLLVDTGYNHIETRKVLEQSLQENNMPEPKHIVLTHAHPDHAPGVLQVANWSPIIYCHTYEKQAIVEAISPYSAVKTVNDGDCFQVANHEIIFLHTPGHTKGHLNLYIPTEKILLAGDNILSEGTTWIGKPDGDMTDYLHSLKRLQSMEIKTIGPGHGQWVENPQKQISFVLERRLFREKQIQKLLFEFKQLTVSELTKHIYQDHIHPSVFEVAKRTTEAHLCKLIKDGEVQVHDDYYMIKS
ncbi:MBL fold metallo-hydrolase [Mesobacillus maritimus]|uniref:MBL fold metallo-hydrolase n=1 Tax=Mesobacillus maritimus TaxID=1643336 RepID=UPI00203A9919|nr:MBL fold metallo-hydrolase [Mesobacillus maritimus]